MNSFSDSFPEFRQLKLLGQGSFSTVYSALHCFTNAQVAIKAIEKGKLTDQVMNRNFSRELEILQKIDFFFASQYYRTLEDQNYYYIIMEFAKHSSLLDYINKNGPLSEKDAQNVFIQLLSILRYLHEEVQITHRDLKMENVLITSGGFLRVIDFGLSAEPTNNGLMETQCGSFPYAAPEIFAKRPYTNAVDMWSAGIILYVLVVGHLPFEGPNTHRLIHAICKEEPEIPRTISPELRDLIVGLLCKEPKNRLTVDQASAHAWVRSAKYSEFASPYFLAQRQFRVLPKTQNDIDPDVINRLREMGILDSTVYDDLVKGVETKCTMTYKILKKEKINYIMMSQTSGRKDNRIVRNESDPQTKKLPSLIQASIKRESINSVRHSTLQASTNLVHPQVNSPIDLLLRRSKAPNSNRPPLMSTLQRTAVYKS